MTMMTETEAKTKRCPFALPIEPDKPIARSMCVATDCMMWRATKGHIEGRRKGSDDMWDSWAWDPRKTAERSYERENYEFREAEGRGYCGLAGPQVLR